MSVYPRIPTIGVLAAYTCCVDVDQYTSTSNMGLFLMSRCAELLCVAVWGVYVRIQLCLLFTHGVYARGWICSDGPRF